MTNSFILSNKYRLSILESDSNISNKFREFESADLFLDTAKTLNTISDIESCIIDNLIFTEQLYRIYSKFYRIYYIIFLKRFFLKAYTNINISKQ